MPHKDKERAKRCKRESYHRIKSLDPQNWNARQAEYRKSRRNEKAVIARRYAEKMRSDPERWGKMLARVRAWNKANRNKRRRAEFAYWSSPKGKLAKRKKDASYRQNNPERYLEIRRNSSARYRAKNEDLCNARIAKSVMKTKQLQNILGYVAMSSLGDSK